jgi:hypothetical protein
MIHIGTADYYAQVRSRLQSCDVVLFEGVRSFRVLLLTLSYRLVAHRKRLKLVAQTDALPLWGLRARLINADVAPGDFDQSWSRIPWHLRIAIAIGAPLLGAYRYLTATRDSIGRRLSLEDIPTADQALRADAMPELDEAILHSRDLKLVAAVEAVLTVDARPDTVGIVYGAGHMRVVTDVLLQKYRFRVAQAEWLTVFDYADG